MGYIGFSLLLFILNLNGLAASVAYFLEFVSNDTESALYALFQTDSLTAIAFTQILMLLSKENLSLFWIIYRKSTMQVWIFNIQANKFVLVFGLRSILDHFHFNLDAKKGSFRFLASTNLQCEWLWKFYFIYVMGGYCGGLIMASAGSILFLFSKIRFCPKVWPKSN